MQGHESSVVRSGAEWCSDCRGKPPVRCHEVTEDVHVTPGWDTCAHLEEHRRTTARLAGLAGELHVVITHHQAVFGH